MSQSQSEKRTQAEPRRNALAPTLAILAVIMVVMMLFSRIYTDLLWFRAVDTPQVFSIRWTTTILLFVIFATLMGVVVGLNMWLVRRISGEQKLPRSTRVMRTMIALALAVLAGVSATNRVETFLGWRNRTDFDFQAPYFGDLDASFFVFDLPWWSYVTQQIGWTVAAALAVSVFLYLTRGKQQMLSFDAQAMQQGRPPRVKMSNPFTPAAQAHVSVLLGLLMIVAGVWTIFKRFQLSISDNDALFTGIGYTDHKSRLVALLVMAVIYFLLAVVFIANAWIRRWIVPTSGIAMAIVSALIVQAIIPGLQQQFVVRPSEPQYENDYIAQQIEATRYAYGIEEVDIQEYQATTTVSPGQLRADALALPGIRLMDPEVIAPTFEQLQQVRGYYSFPNVLDVDRYTIDGEETDAIVAVREIHPDGLPADSQSWNNVHTVYTHGYAMVGAYGNRRQASGEPEWISRDIPPVGALSQTQPRVYFGENTKKFAIVGAPESAPPVELDTPGGREGGGETYNTYDGKGGVPVGNFFNRMLYAIRFGDLNLLLSSRVNSESKILYDRTPAERVRAIAPWLNVDQDPYPAIVDGRVVWIVDGYTTSNSFPNSQRIDLSNSLSDSMTTFDRVGVARVNVNYVRNSVKAVVDAYDGTVDLYAWDADDPLLQTWNKSYPGVLKDKSEISADLLAHMRYPQDMFKVQREVLGRYHMTDPQAWYQQSDLWRVPADPRRKDFKEPPYYLSIKWPGEEQPKFSLTAVYVPNQRENLGAYIAAVADAADPDYGKLRVLRLSDTHQVSGPNQTYNAIQADDRVQQRLLPFTSQGAAEPVYGNLLTLPLGGGLIYVEPIYTRGRAQGSYPVLRFIAVRFGDQIGIGETLQQALDMAFQGDAGVDTGEQPDQKKPAGEENLTAQERAKVRLREASQAFTAADEALKNGDLGEYQRQVKIAQQKLQEADQALQ